MFREIAECSHTDVASHGIELGDPLSGEAMLHEDHEAGWCRGCSRYVQRELDCLTWFIRPGYARGVWMWRADDAPAVEMSEAEEVPRALDALPA